MRSGQARRIAQLSHGQASNSVDGWDAAKADAPPGLLQSGFQLAHFIFPERAIAIQILVRALEKTRILSRREVRRLYWRDKHAERPVRRVARSDVDMLQWLIMFESEQDERAQERLENPSTTSMTIRYVKHLVQVTTALSSFHVNVGLTRLLHNYSTAEAQRVYEMLMSRYLGADVYRRAKAALMERVSGRFAGRLRVMRQEHGEHRFETFSNQQLWVEVVAASLRAFTPWSTQRICSEFLNLNVKRGSARPIGNHGNQNETEMRCCHILIEPACYSQLMRELAFELPNMKLAVPRFFMNENVNNSDDNYADRGRAPALCQGELDQIEQQLAARDTRRRNIDSRSVMILIDGVERGRLGLAEARQLHLSLEAGASLVEIRGQDEQGDLVLATHFISYANDLFESSTATAIIGQGRMKFRITPSETSETAPSRATLTLSYEPKMNLLTGPFPWRIGLYLTKPIRSYGLVAAAIALIGWGIAGAFFARRVQVLEQQLQQAHRSRELLPTTAGAIVSYRLAKDDKRVRGADVGDIPEISLRLHSRAITLQLPLSQAIGGQTYSAEVKIFEEDQPLLTENFLRVKEEAPESFVEIVVPTDLLKSNTYYTVYLHSSQLTDRYTFKVSME